jgi:hypothetical protein
MSSDKCNLESSKERELVPWMQPSEACVTRTRREHQLAPAIGGTQFPEEVSSEEKTN